MARPGNRRGHRVQRRHAAFARWLEGFMREAMQTASALSKFRAVLNGTVQDLPRFLREGTIDG